MRAVADMTPEERLVAAAIIIRDTIEEIDTARAIEAARVERAA